MHTGIIDNLANDAYQGDHAASKSGIKYLLDPEHTPMHFFHQFRLKNRVRRPPTKDQLFGQAVHDLVLQPELFEANYVEYNKRRSGKLWDTFKADAEKAGKQVLFAGDTEKAHDMLHALHAHPEARKLLPGVNPAAKAETSFFWNDPITGIRCKCRTDIIIPDMGIVVPDLKTCRSASPAAFTWDVHEYGYDIQDAAYTTGLNILMPGEVKEFKFICIEKEPPYCIAIYTLPNEYKEIGYIKYRRGIDIIARCETEGSWPGFPEAAVDIMPPGKLLREYDIGNMDNEEGDYEPEGY